MVQFVCAEFSFIGLNASPDHCYPLPILENIFTMLNDESCFAKRDGEDAYLQVEVSPQSRELLTINTNCGSFRYNRLPFGVKSATVFEQIMDSMISGVRSTL